MLEEDKAENSGVVLEVFFVVRSFSASMKHQSEGPACQDSFLMIMSLSGLFFVDCI